MNRSVVVLAGLNYVGKTWHQSVVLGLPEMTGAKVVSMDAIRADLYPGRADTHITKTEHLFKNEEMRRAIVRELVLGTPTVLVDTVMLTRANHQRPFVEMVHHALWYVTEIEREAFERDGSKFIEACEVNLRTIVFFCSLERLRDRIARNSIARKVSGTLVFDLVAMRGAVEAYEYPSLYKPLYLDTSDESQSAHDIRVSEIQMFLARGILPENNSNRRKKMVQCHLDIKVALPARI